MLPWYLAEPPVGMGAAANPYADAQAQLGKIASLVNANLTVQYVSAATVTAIAAAASTLQADVAAFSSTDSATITNNPIYPFFIAMIPTAADAGPNGYQLPSIAEMGQYATELQGMVAALPGANGGSSSGAVFNPTPNAPLVISTSTGGRTAVSRLTPVVVASSTTQGTQTSTPNYNPTTGVTTNNPPPPGFNAANAPTTTVPTSSGPVTVPTTTSSPGGAVTTDPSTGATVVTSTNPDGSTTVTTDNGPGGEAVSTTIPPPYLYFFHPRDDSGKLVLALGVGALVISLLVLAVNSEEGEKVLDAVAAPIDDAAKAVGVPDLPPIPVPELPTENPIRRRRKRKGRRRNPEPLYVIQVERRSGVFTAYNDDVFTNRMKAERHASKLESRLGKRTRVIRTLR
jgi:hypothetical protein